MIKGKLLKALLVLGIIVSVMGIVWMSRGWYMSWENSQVETGIPSKPIIDFGR